MRRGNIIVNFLTVMVLLSSCGSVAYAATVFSDPYIFINPFPPPTPVSIAVLPTSTATPTFSTFPTFPPTATASRTPTNTPQPTDTPAATFTETFTDTPQATATDDLTQIAQLTEKVPTNTSEPTNTFTPVPTPSKTRSVFPFTVQGGGPTPTQNYANSAGCNWMGIAGQPLNLDGNGIPQMMVHLEGGGIDADAITGSKNAYGPGGYEFFLNNRPVQTTGEYRIQLFDRDGKTPLSDVVVVDTYADCSRNLLLVYFVQNH